MSRTVLCCVSHRRSSGGGGISCGQQLIIVVLTIMVLLRIAANTHMVVHRVEEGDNSWIVAGHRVSTSPENNRNCATSTMTGVKEEEEEEGRASSSSSVPDNSISRTTSPAILLPERQPANKTTNKKNADGIIPQFLRDMPSEPQTMNSIRVGLCAIIKGAERYIDEWVDYNLFGIGFHEIYIFDNSDNFTLQEWSKKHSSPRVQVVSFTVRSPPCAENKGFVQLSAMNACVKQFGPRSDVVAFFDDDEFLVLKKHRTVGDYVSEYLKRNTSLSINWEVFGTANHTQYSPIPVTKRFQYRMNETDPGVKAMVWVDDYLRMANPHAVFLKHAGPESHRNANGQRGQITPNGMASLSRPNDVAVLHHYKYKSEAEYYEKSCIRQDVMDVARNVNCGTSTKVGDVFDDSAWQILKTRVPGKYEHFDHWVDYF